MNVADDNINRNISDPVQQNPENFLVIDAFAPDFDTGT
jgi:hypothetical protein